MQRRSFKNEASGKGSSKNLKMREEEEMTAFLGDDNAPLVESDDHSADETKIEINQNVRKDLHNIALLMFLYLLQGIPLGLSGSVPYVLSSRKVSYTDQGTFSFALWPFSLKLLW